jgi:redox-sensitive bicupin YhaK (pirin superfamily)
LRSVAHVTAERTLEGAGFPVRRPFPTRGLQLVDPFLLLDELGPWDVGPGEAKGAPDHPHRGFETVTYLLSGAMRHRDSAGNAGQIGPGDVQWHPYLHYTVQPGGTVTKKMRSSHNVFAGGFCGAGRFGADARQAHEAPLVIFGEGDAVAFAAEGEAPLELLLIGGQPLGEPMARHGPFVMNTEAEIHQAFADFRSGRMGRIAG